MANLVQGRQAEQVAAAFLKDSGFKILNRNWKTKICEIDIVAQKNQRIYFVEVKYRATDNQGSGLEYITPAKLKKMHLAARVWVQTERFDGDYSLAAVEVSGPGFSVTNLLEEL